MNFREFRNSSKYVDDIGAVINDESLEGIPGLVFAENLYIEEEIIESKVGKIGSGKYFLTLGNEIYTDMPLLSLQAMLYSWAVDEGYFD